MSVIRALIAGMIDYAGLFPPAALDMKTVVRNYALYADGEESWALGRLIVPVGRLPEFTDAFNEVCCDEREKAWLLSVLGLSFFCRAGRYRFSTNSESVSELSGCAAPLLTGNSNSSTRGRTSFLER